MKFCQTNEWVTALNIIVMGSNTIITPDRIGQQWIYDVISNVFVVFFLLVFACCYYKHCLKMIASDPYKQNLNWIILNKLGFAIHAFNHLFSHKHFTLLSLYFRSIYTNIHVTLNIDFLANETTNIQTTDCVICDGLCTILLWSWEIDQ